MIIGVVILIVGALLGWVLKCWHIKFYNWNVQAWAAAQKNWFSHREMLEKDNLDLSERLYIATHPVPLEKKSLAKKKKK